jgi:hypothetical protein
MSEDAKVNAENPPDTKDETKDEELKPEQLDEVTGGTGGPGKGR